MKCLLTVVVLFAASVAHAGNARSYPPRPEALATMASGGGIALTQGSFYYSFAPTGAAPARGLILYPGALVDHRAYAPLARAIAERGFRTVVVEMPADIAFLGIERATLARLAFRDTKNWALAGHSLGGVAACTYARTQPGRVSALVLLAAYPSSSDSLRFRRLPVLSLYGTHDGLTTPAEIEKSKRLLPPSTVFTAIVGGNHTQFGSYWDGQTASFVQSGDDPGTIDAATQQQAIVDALTAFLR